MIKIKTRTIADAGEGGEMGSHAVTNASDTKLNLYLPHQPVIAVISIYFGKQKHSSKNLSAAVTMENSSPNPQKSLHA